MGISILAALPYLFAPLGDDTARYRWEGWSLAQGGNPYTQVPDKLSAASIEAMPVQAKKLWSEMNHKNETAIYGPAFILAMALWSKISLHDLPYHLLAFSSYALILVLLHFLIRKRKLASEYLFLASLNPLILIYLPGEGHNEVFILPLLLAACLFHESSETENPKIFDPMQAGAAFCLGLMLGIKLTALVFLPLLLPKSRGVWKALIHLPFFLLPLAAYLPFLGSPASLFQALGFESRNFHYNDSFHYLFRTFFDGRAWIPGLACLSLGFALIHLLVRDRLLAIFWGAFWFLLFSPTIHPWYLAPLLVLNVLFPTRAALAFSALFVFTFPLYETLFQTGLWQEQAWTRFAIYPVVLIFIILDLSKKRARPML